MHSGLLAGRTRKPRPWIMVALALLLAGLPARAETLEQRISMKGPYSIDPIRVWSSSAIILQNDGKSTLHRTTISRTPSGSRLAQIMALKAGQMLNLEFSQEGAYSICFFLAPEALPDQERCLYLDVMRLRTATDTRTQPLLPGTLS